MTIRRSLQALLAALVLLLPLAVGAEIPGVVLTSFSQHQSDARIRGMLGYAEADASILYFGEMGSITAEESKIRQIYEPVGCLPFYVMHDGKQVEIGYNCYSFACVGYKAGPKQCVDTENRAYGGVTEINRRLSFAAVIETDRPFSEFPASEQTSSMKAKTAELAPYRCEPFYLRRYDVAVGEGVRCDEVGRYPRYSAAFRCVDDWRDKEGRKCDVPVRDDEMELRAEYLGISSSSSSSSVSSSAGSSSVPGVSSSSASSVQAVTFTDVQQGKYGYTAITTLGGAGMVEGYADGTFKPNKTVNRAEFSKMLLAALFPEEAKDGVLWCFPDVHAEWFAPYVCAAKRLQWLMGYADGTFRPSRTITKAEAIKIIVNSAGLTTRGEGSIPFNIDPNQWYAPSVRRAVESGIILEPSFFPAQETTRADAAVWIYRVARMQGKL